MRFKRHIMAPGLKTNEMVYKGNLGFEELVAYYRKASKKELKIIEDLIRKEDWAGFKVQIQKVIGVKLQ